ncbi:Na(+)-translocating NADH-quinone reductase subunit F [Mangrovimonas sp. CR14]|uniref:Na(+)-translocating NADH-quinone reductase subunit F n=1 Tax=Mangrovimonas sp. CR14 TaxID=2706120 RepID=UPI0014238C97|nr:Na(+)-translocating NADH-quinone reductase subunit F [Mangrovimonas sp. CR14]NIK91306.1 Na(+)-translocating NADH-quinone reductase subunit F [Mangrovimonas sp. CR14]
MRTSNRFNCAIEKLYQAFHSNRLHPECCKQCAVGNILDGQDFWKHLSDDHGSTQLNLLGKLHQAKGKRFNGYTPQELLYIEVSFLNACGYELPVHYRNNKPDNPQDKDLLFQGLSAVVSTLCELDQIPDVMDCTQLFKFRAKSKKASELIA